MKRTCINFILSILFIFSVLTIKNDKKNGLKTSNIKSISNCRDLLTTEKLRSSLKNKKDFIFDMKDYISFGQSLPSKLTEDLKEKKINILKEVNGKVSWLPCRLHPYTEDDVEKCIQERGDLHAYFLGDSRGRQEFEAMIRITKNMNWNISLSHYIDLKNSNKSYQFGMNSDIYLNKIFHNMHNLTFKWGDFRAESSDTDKPGLHLHSKTIQDKTALLEGKTTEQMLRDELNIISNFADPILPSFIILSFMSWYFDADEHLLGLDNCYNKPRILTKTLRTVLEKLNKRGTKLIWLLLDPVKQSSWSMPGFVKNYNMELCNSLAISSLRSLYNEGLIELWDSGIPMTARAVLDCNSLTKHTSNPLNNSPDWTCYDTIHAGPQATSGHAQLLLNLFCNSVTKKSSEYCCSNKD